MLFKAETLEVGDSRSLMTEKSRPKTYPEQYIYLWNADQNKPVLLRVTTTPKDILHGVTANLTYIGNVF